MPIHSQPKTLSAWTVIALSWIPLIMVLGNSMLIPILPMMQEQLQIKPFQSSLVITLFSVPAGIVIPFAGYLSDRYGRLKVIIPALLLYALGGLLAGLAAAYLKQPFWLIMGGRIIQGVGAAGTSPIAMALISDLYAGAARSKVLGINEAANGLGKVISPLLGAWVAMITWYAVFFTFPLLCAIAVLLLILFVKEGQPAQEAQSFRQYSAVLKHTFQREWKWLITAYLAGASALFILFGILIYLSHMLEDQYGIDGIRKGGILAVPLLAMAITSYLTGASIKKQTKRMKWWIVLGFVLLAIALGMAAFLLHPVLLLCLLVLGGVGTGLTLPCLNTFITSAVSKAERGIVTSFYGAVRFLGVAFGPPIFTWLFSLSPTLMFLAAAALSVIVAMLTLWLIRPQEHGEPPADQRNKRLSSFLREEGSGQVTFRPRKRIT